METKNRTAGFFKKLSSFQRILLGFTAVILTGTLLLMLPVSSSGSVWTSFSDALFTSTSAACVTGLVVRDTAGYWSSFGQAVILILIQIGGLGIVAVTVFIATVSGKKIDLKKRSLLQESISAHQVGGIVRMTSFIFRMVFIIEIAGALIMLPSYMNAFGAEGIWMAVFHSVSAFCNAGFDVMGDRTGAFSSLTFFASAPGVVLPICFLIVIGGIGFLTWDDISVHGFSFRRYRMQSKVILTSSAILILFPAAVFFFADFSSFPLKERLCLSLFQSVTLRTAGFNTADLNAMTSAGRGLMIPLMLIGGSPGSTAGGLKTTTCAVLLASAVSVFRRKKSPELFGRRIDEYTVRCAAALLSMYLILPFAGAFIISCAEGLSFGVCLFETVSAIGTVGLTLGITPGLGTLSRAVLILLMFFGRAGGLTVIFAAVNTGSAEVSQLPVEKINVG